MVYDIAIIGTGPAGMMAAVYAARKGNKTLLVGKETGGQVGISGEIDNYLGFPSIDGTELSQKFKQHIWKYENIELIESKEIKKLIKQGDEFELTDQDDKKYMTQSVILATGRITRWLNVPGEEKFKGRGVSACATCDGPFFKDKAVVVVGGGNSGLEAVELLDKFASKITLITNETELRGDKFLRDKISHLDKVDIIYGSTVTKIMGDMKVGSIMIKNLKTQEEKELNTDGVFVEIGYEPPRSIEALTDKDDYGTIKVNNKMESSCPGIYAPGDANDFSEAQIIIAAGEGATAAIEASKYLSKKS